MLLGGTVRESGSRKELSKDVISGKSRLGQYTWGGGAGGRSTSQASPTKWVLSAKDNYTQKVTGMSW